MRWISVRVFPEPGPATMRSGPSTIAAAALWSSSRDARMLVVADGLFFFSL
jgi:hypothetical protein